MKQPRVGLIVGGERVTGAAILPSGRFAHWNFEADDGLPTRIQAELESLGVPGLRLRVALDRNLVVVKPIDVPQAASRDLGRIVGFELERHVPYPAEDLRFDWLVQPSPGEGLRVLVAVCETRTASQALRLLEAIGRRPRSLTVASHDLRSLLPRRLAARRAVWIHRGHDCTDLLCLGDGAVILSRRLPRQPPKVVADEVRRTLLLVGWSTCEGLWISGDEADRFAAAPIFAELGAPVSAPPYRRRVAALVSKVPAEEHAAALPALAVALGAREPSLDLLPKDLRPRRLSRAQWVTAGLATLAGLLGVGLFITHGYTQDRYTRRVTDEIRRLEPEAKAVEKLASELAVQRRLLLLVRKLDEGGVRPLAVLDDLTGLVPADAWLQSLTMDRQGVELTGQASAASQLIPLLEGSPALERVEFTSPVTKAQGKEQFRLRAMWETSPTPRATKMPPSPSEATGAR